MRVRLIQVFMVRVPWGLNKAFTVPRARRRVLSARYRCVTFLVARRRVRLKHDQSPLATSFCEALFHSSHDIVIAEDTTLNPRFSSHPLVTGPPHIRFYAAARLTVNAQTVGSLCGYDMAPKQISAEQREQLWVLAQAAMKLLADRVTTLPER